MSSFSEDLVVDTAENEPRKGFKKGPLKSLPSVKGFRLRREVENVDPADDARVQGAYRRGQLHGGGEVLVAFYSTQGRVHARQAGQTSEGWFSAVSTPIFQRVYTTT